MAMEGENKGKGQVQPEGVIYVVALRDTKHAHMESTPGRAHRPLENEASRCNARSHMMAPLRHGGTREVDRPRIHTQSGPPSS